MRTGDRKFPFVSGLRTGTGSEESIAHGLGSIPDDVWCNLDSTSSKSYIMGTHTSAVIKVTVTNGAPYRIHAGMIAG